MAQTERKEVKKPGDLNTSYTAPPSNSTSKTNGLLPNGSTQGLVKDLTFLGTGFLT